MAKIIEKNGLSFQDFWRYTIFDRYFSSHQYNLQSPIPPHPLTLMYGTILCSLECLMCFASIWIREEMREQDKSPEPKYGPMGISEHNIIIIQLLASRASIQFSSSPNIDLHLLPTLLILGLDLALVPKLIR